MTNLEPSELSEREREILRLVATGASNKEIGQRLFISSNTVKVHLRNIFIKIGAASRTEAAMYAVRIGLAAADDRPALHEEDETPALSITTSQAIPDPGAAARPAPGLSTRQLMFSAGLILMLLVVIILGAWLARRGGLWGATPASATTTPAEQWKALPNMPTARRGLAAVGYGNHIYAVGGETSTGISGVMECYEPAANNWSTLSAKPLPVADASAAVIGGQIYVPGGRTTSGQATERMEIYDPAQDAWTEGPALPRPISAYALAAYEGQLFLFGGWDGQTYLDTLYIYNPDQQAWIEDAPMPTRRAFASAVVSENLIYVVGGTDDGQKALATNEVYQPNQPEAPWSQAAPLPVGRYGMGSANIAGVMHVFGGQGKDPALAGLAYDAQQGRWGQIETPLQQSLASPGVATLGPRLYVLGGADAEGLSSLAWVYQAVYIITLPIVR